MSAVRLGPVISTMELVWSAGRGRMLSNSSRFARMRERGNTAIWAGGRSEIRRASLGLESMTKLPVSASA